MIQYHCYIQLLNPRGWIEWNPTGATISFSEKVIVWLGDLVGKSRDARDLIFNSPSLGTFISTTAQSGHCELWSVVDTQNFSFPASKGILFFSLCHFPSFFFLSLTVCYWFTGIYLDPFWTRSWFLKSTAFIYKTLRESNFISWKFWWVLIFFLCFLGFVLIG